MVNCKVRPRRFEGGDLVLGYVSALDTKDFQGGQGGNRCNIVNWGLGELQFLQLGEIVESLQTLNLGII